LLKHSKFYQASIIIIIIYIIEPQDPQNFPSCPKNDNSLDATELEGELNVYRQKALPPAPHFLQKGPLPGAGVGVAAGALAGDAAFLSSPLNPLPVSPSTPNPIPLGPNFLPWQDVQYIL
jgi:hypothetical protein